MCKGASKYWLPPFLRLCFLSTHSVFCQSSNYGKVKVSETLVGSTTFTALFFKEYNLIDAKKCDLHPSLFYMFFNVTFPVLLDAY